MTEKPKRLAPKLETLRELFLKSGNLCAYPSCARLMMNVEGKFIGQLCHIEAAETGGPRFNPSMTNQQRRAVSNLMLMCYEHHVITNDAKKFPVQKLENMKREHERRFSSPDRAILEQLKDWTLADQPRRVENLGRIDQVLTLKSSDEERAAAVAEMNEYIERFSKVPIEVRKFLGAIAQRMHRMWDSKAVSHDSGGTSILISDVKDALRLSDTKIRNRLSQMQSYGLGDLDEINTDLGPQPMIRISNPEAAPSWIDIVEFCDKEAVFVSSFTDDLDFSQLDS